MPPKNLTNDQIQAVVNAAKEATHFRHSQNSAWFVITKVDDSVALDKQTIEVDVGEFNRRVYAIAELNYNAIGFDKRVPVKLPPIHRLSPMIESLGRNLAKYKDMVNSGVDNAADFKEAFGGLHNHFLYEVGITDAMTTIKKHEWLVESGCTPMLACMVVHLENLSTATMHYDNGHRAGLHASIYEMDYWKYLFHSINILVTALQAVIENQLPDKA